MGNRFFKRDIISIDDFSREEMEQVLSVSAELKQKPYPSLLKNKVIASCFFEASTRTRLSFETAVQWLGGTSIGFADGCNTSAQKGETLADSIKIISSYTDALIIRHPLEGAARLASEFANIPVINGGDGSNQHPTQTLLDLFSIRECQGQLDDLEVTFVGDLKYGRTVHSLVQALTWFNAKFYFIAPDALLMPGYMLQELSEKGCQWQRVESIEEVIGNTDIIYMTRVQKERFDETEYKHIASKYVLTDKVLSHALPHMKILHPLPRVDEITVEVDQTPYAYYFEQARNGVFVRMALLSLILNEKLP